MDDLPPVRIRQGRSLPHWTSQGAPAYVTMRLGDALPAHVIDEQKREIREKTAHLERLLGRELTEHERKTIRFKYAGRIERFLDTGHGECLLRHPQAATIVQRSFQMYAGERYDLDAWCVMPNHAHILLTPYADWPLEKITYDWKHGSARLVNRILGRKGPVWQNESFDHLPRDETRLERFPN